MLDTTHVADRMKMDRSRIVKALGGQRAHCAPRSPFYASVLAELEQDAATGAYWVVLAEEAWKNRSFAVAWEAAHLLLAGLHYLVLKGEAPELAAIYPSVGGSGAAPNGRVRDFMAKAPPSLWNKLRDARVQTNEVDRSVPWMLVAAAAFRSRGIPFHFVEIGASAGLNLIGDHVPHDCRFLGKDDQPVDPPVAWNGMPHAAVSRDGLDLFPRHLSNPEDRLWLKACVWAEDTARLARLDRAVDAFLKLEGVEGGPRLTRCPFSQAPVWIMENLTPRAGEGLLVFNSIATVYLGHEEYWALQDGMARALQPWKDRGFWVEYERPRGAENSPLEIKVHRAVDGRLQTRVLGSGGPRPDLITLRSGWDFLKGAAA
jgi:hypothetical protein